MTRNKKCQFEGCDKMGVMWASGRYDWLKLRYPVGWYCESHADRVSNEGHPEHVEDCPRCGCRFGVN